MKSKVWSGVKIPAVIALPPVLVVIFFFILPYGASFVPALRATGGNEISILENTALLNVTLFTIKQAFLSVLVSLALGLPGAWFIGRRSESRAKASFRMTERGEPSKGLIPRGLPRKAPSGAGCRACPAVLIPFIASGHSRFYRLLKSLTVIPFAMPSILAVLGFVLFFGNSGWLNRLFFAFTGSETTFRILYQPQAIILAHGFFNFPLVIRLVGDGLDKARRAYAPAAASLGASPFITALTVILPLSFPALMAAALLVFLYCFTSFAVVLVLGGGPASTTLAVEIYRHARVFLNYHNAGVLALMETLIAVCVFLTYVFFGRKSRKIKIDVHERITEAKKTHLLPRIILIMYGLALVFFVLGPLISIPLESFLYRQSRSALQVVSFRWWQSLGDTCLPALFRSLALAFCSATTACILAILSAGAVKLLEQRAKGNSLTAHLIRFCAAAPLVSSGIVLGLGWLILYGRNFSRAPFALVILHGVIALPFAFNFISEGFRSLPENILNAASVFGASPLRGLLTTALPLSLPRIRSAWGFAAALSLGELNAVMMLGIEWETLPLYIYRAVGAYRYGTACAAGTLLILGCAWCLTLSEARIFNSGKKYA